MNAFAEPSPAIALWLAGMWSFYKSGQFLNYLVKTYGTHVDRSPSFECIYIAEAEEGDLDTGRIGGIIKKWWMVDDAGLTEVIKLKPFSTDESVLFDQRPVLKFYTDGERVVFGERLGPNLICRKGGKVVAAEASVSITDIHLLWTPNDLN